MDEQGTIVVLGVYSAVAVPSVVFTLIALWKRKQWIRQLRVLAAAPYLIHGVVSVHLFHGVRQSPDLTYATDLLLSVGIKACIGILLPVWSFIAGFIARNRLSRDRNSGRVYTARKSSGYLYLCIVDAIVLALLAFSVVLAYRFLPLGLHSCWNLRSERSTRLFFYVKEATGDVNRAVSCQRVLMVQITTLLTMTIMTLQALHLTQFASLPGFCRVAVIFIIGAIRVISCRDKSRHRHHSLEDRDTPSDEKKTTLASLFQSNGVAAHLVSHLHYRDVINASLTSKATRNAVFSLSKKGSRERAELLAVNSCDVVGKEQCWACATLICQSCTVFKGNVKAPRTTQHMADCYAICTGCYLLRGAGQPAPFLATLYPGNLAVQRPCCSDSAVVSPQRSGKTPLCLHCSALDTDQITAIREERETQSLRLGTSLRRRIYCAKCAKALSGDRKRWWLYDCGPDGLKHSHECHWIGHSIKK